VAADNACTGLVGNRLNLATGLSDNCTLAGSLALSQLPAAATVLSGHNDFRAVTLSATDAAGNTGTCSFNVTLKDISPPTITCPANFTLAADAQCEGLVGDGTALVTGVSDNCTAAAAIALTQSPAANTVISGHNAFQVVTVTADDGNGNTKSCNYQVTLKDVSPPTMTCPQDHTVAANQFCYNYVGDIFLLVADLKDNCTPVANIIKTQVPDANTVLVGHNSFRNVTISADDGLGNVKTCSLTVTLKDITPPVVSCPGPLLRGCAINIPLPNPGLASAFDNCGPAFITHLSDSAPYDQTCADRFKITRTYKAQDGAGNTATCTQVITVNDVQTPYFTSSPSNTTVQCNAIPSVGTPVAVDGCGGGVTISYLGETRTNGSCADTYTLVRTWRATDQCGNSRTVTQRISVRDTQKPTFTFIPANITIACTTPLPSPGQPTAVDNCDTDVSIAYYGEWNMSSTCPGTYQLLRYWQATDNCGNAAFGSQIITVQDNQAPVFTSVPAPVTINCNDPIPPTVNPTVYDSCGNFTQVTFLGTVRTDGSCLYNYTLTRSWRAEDYCGNSATVSQVITVRDVQAPVFNNPPANISVTCANIPGAPALSATDNCGSGTVTYLGQTTSPGDCASGYTIERRWRAADLCANTRLHTQTITVMPNQYVPGVSGRETGAEANRAVPGFRLVPNPASGRVRLDLADFKGKSLQLALLTPHGALVYEQKIWSDGEAPVFIDLHALGIASGLYLVSVRTAEGQVWVERLLVQQE
ncbi:MAG: hypothetical protein JNK89_06345, partial [Saprospiraceae bacterium]|nr:hypothetical protein [Saprospiraceae bacterium]